MNHYSPPVIAPPAPPKPNNDDSNGVAKYHKPTEEEKAYQEWQEIDRHERYDLLGNKRNLPPCHFNQSWDVVSEVDITRVRDVLPNIYSEEDCYRFSWALHSRLAYFLTVAGSLNVTPSNSPP